MLSENLNTDKQHQMKIQEFKDKHLGKLVTIQDVQPEGLYGTLVELEIPDPEHSLELDCLAVLHIHDPDLLQLSEGDEYWNIPCFSNEIRLLDIH